jgi:hypothetical protein
MFQYVTFQFLILSAVMGSFYEEDECQHSLDLIPYSPWKVKGLEALFVSDVVGNEIVCLLRALESYIFGFPHNIHDKEDSIYLISYDARYLWRLIHLQNALTVL